MKNNKILVQLIMSIIFIIIIVIYGFLSYKNDNISYQDKNKSIIYNREDSTEMQNIPYINLKGNEIDYVNEEINYLVSDIIGDENITINYNYNKSGVILSVIISVVNYDSIAAPEVIFYSYNIDLSNNHVLSNDELLKLYSYDNQMIENEVYDIFYSYYNQSEIVHYCDPDCFKNDLKNYFTYPDDIALFLNNNKLFIYVSANEKMEYLEYLFFEKHEFNWEVGEIYD